MGSPQIFKNRMENNKSEDLNESIGVIKEEEEDGIEYIDFRSEDEEDVTKRATIRRKAIRAGKFHRSGISEEQSNNFTECQTSEKSGQEECFENLFCPIQSLDLSDLTTETTATTENQPGQGERRSRMPLFKTMATSLDISLLHIPSTEERLGENKDQNEEEAPLLEVCDD